MGEAKRRGTREEREAQVKKKRVKLQRFLHLSWKIGRGDMSKLELMRAAHRRGINE